MALTTEATYSTQAEFNSYSKNDWSALTLAEWNKVALLAEDIVDSYIQIPKRDHFSCDRKVPFNDVDCGCGKDEKIPCDITKAHIIITENELLKKQNGLDSQTTLIGGNSDAQSEEWSSSSYKISKGSKSGLGSAGGDYEQINVGIPPLANRLLAKYRNGMLQFTI